MNGEFAMNTAPPPKKRQMAKLLAVFAVVFSIAALIVNDSGAADFSDVAVSAGYRTDNIDWNIAGNTSGTNPNILSELKWKDIDVYTLRLTGRTVIEDTFYLRAYADYGWITGGTNQDSDYNGDNRTLEYSRSNNSADGGNVWDLSGGVGLKKSVAIGSGAFDIMPLVGLSYHAQNLTITNGWQTIPPRGAFSGLDSSYDARWAGPWAGADAAYTHGKLIVNGTAEIHYAFYSAEANWNLRTDLQHPKSFEHWATGYGVVGSLGLEYALAGAFSVSGRIEAESWQATNGTDRTFFADGGVADTRLNEVNRDSVGASVGVKYRFE